jgi:pimeloyl-ACP methyl ester carboxylesterase
MSDSSQLKRNAAQSPLVAFLHGSAGAPRQWQPHMQRLGLRYRVIAPALLGYAGTPEWAADASVSFRSEAAHLEQLLDLAAGGIHLVGHSYGAAVALHFALQHPAQVRSLTLYEPPLFHLLRQRADRPADATAGGALRHAVQRRYEAGDLAGAAWVFVDYWCGDGAWQQLPATRQQTIASRMPKVAAELRAALEETTPIARYAELRMPVLLLHGERTRTTMRQIVQTLAGVLRRPEVLQVPGADHMGAITHAETLCTLVDDFLESQREGEHRFAWTHVLRSRLDDGAAPEPALALRLRGMPAA